MMPVILRLFTWLIAIIVDVEDLTFIEKNQLFLNELEF